MNVRIITVFIFAAPWLLGACASQNDSANNGDGDLEPSISEGETFDSEWLNGCPVEIAQPSPPDLPECLQGENPTGCAELPELPECLQGDNPTGCAALPVLESWECPDNWNAMPGFTDENGVENPPEDMEQFTYCIPPEPPAQCPVNMMPLLGQTDCVHIGDACPDGTFPNLPEGTAGSVLHVLTGSSGGDGSSDAPFGTIGEAVAIAVDGDVVLIGEGLYQEHVKPLTNISLIGACVDRVTIESTGEHDKNLASVIADGTMLTVKNLTLKGTQIGLLVDNQSNINASNLQIVEASRAGIMVRDESTTNISGSMVAGTQVVNDEGYGYGFGIAVVNAKSCTINDTSILRNNVVGFIVASADPIQITNSIIASTIEPGSEYINCASGCGSGVTIEEAADINFSKILIDNNTMAGFVAAFATRDAPNIISLEDVVISNTQSSVNSNEILSNSLVALDGVRLSGNRVVLTGSKGNGTVIFQTLETDGTPSLVLEQSIIKKNSGQHGNGIYLDPKSNLMLTDVLIDTHEAAGIYAAGTGDSPQTQVDITDVVLRNNRDGGIKLFDGAKATINRTLIDNNGNSGITIQNAFPERTAANILTDVTVTDMREEGTLEGVGIITFGAANVEMSGIILRRCRDAALQVQAQHLKGKGHIQIKHLLATETLSGTRGPGLGLSVIGDIILTINGARLSQNLGWAALFEQGQGSEKPPEVEINDFWVHDTTNCPKEDEACHAIGVYNGASVTGTRWLVEQNDHVGIFVSPKVLELSPELHVNELTVRDTNCLPGIHKPSGKEIMMCTGIHIQDRSIITLQDLLLERNNSGGVNIIGTEPSSSNDDVEPTQASLSNVLVRDHTIDIESSQGEGISIINQADVSISGLVVDQVQRNGVLISKDSIHKTTLAIEDFIVRNTKPGLVLHRGRGISIQGNADVSLSRGKIENNVELGLFLGRDPDNPNPPKAVVEDLVVSGTLNVGEELQGVLPRGIDIQDGADFTLRRALLNHNAGVGIFAIDEMDGAPCTMLLEDVTIRNSEPQTDGRWGRGLEVSLRAQVTANRLLLENNREVGLIVYGTDQDPQTSLNATDVCILNTRFAACGEITEGEEGACVSGGINYGAGHGLAVVEGADASINFFWIEGSALAGVLIAREGKLHLENGGITGNKIGLNILNDNYNYSLFDNNVLLFDNQVNNAKTEIPIPDPATAIKGYDYY